MSEVEKLRALLAEARHEIATWHLGPRDPLVRRIDAALAEPVSDDFRRGAEAMREVAASCIGSDIALLQTYRSVLEGRIRALPVPEDKP